MKRSAIKVSIILGLCSTGLVLFLVILYQYSIRQGLERGDTDQAWSIICTERSHAAELNNPLRAKLISESSIPRDATYTDGFIIMGHYAIILAKQNDRTRDFVYVYRITNENNAAFLRQFYIDRG
jgi:hypothetical protein